jgi:hypothetical protein
MLELLKKVFGKKHHPSKEETVKTDSRREAIHRINARLQELHSSINDHNTREKCSEFYELVKSSLREILSIKYEATFQEISEELEKRKRYSAAVHEELDSFLEDIGLMEYGYAQFKELLDEKRHDQEKHLMEYIHDLEREGEKVEKKTKKKIAAIVSDSVPHSDREFLIKMVERFRAILHQIS